MWLYFCHIQSFPYFFFLTFNGLIVTLSSTNITFDHTFATFGCTHIFFSHLIVSSSNCAVSILHVTILSLHLVVPFFFLTFNGSIVTLGSNNILFYHTFLTFDGTLIFTHIWQYHHHIGLWTVPTSLCHLFSVAFLVVWWFVCATTRFAC